MDDLWKRDEIDSPCVNICVIHEDAGICIGCKRTRQEIAGWSGMTPELRLKTISTLPERKILLKSKRKGGRKGRFI